MQTIAILDYGMGNLRSVKKALEHVAANKKIIITDNKETLNDADKIVFPGQGSTKACLEAIKKHDLENIIKKSALEKPFLGICLGMQLLFEKSEEDKHSNCLSILKGEVKKLPNIGIKIPHMGWNKVKQTKSHPLWHNIADNSFFYSVHSYYVVPNSKEVEQGESYYGINFTSVVAKGNIFAVQFHPEKSQSDGLKLLKNFANWS